MECQHRNTKVDTIKKTFLDMNFNYECVICKDCGAYLRDDSFETAFLGWLEKCYKEKRDRFQVQCSLSQSIIDCAEKILVNYPGVQVTVLFRTLSAIYINVIDVNDEISRKLDELLDEDILCSFKNDGARKRVNIQFKPAMMLDIVAISELIEMKPAQIVEESVLKMMTVITSADPKLKAFWEQNIRHYFEVFLKSA